MITLYNKLDLSGSCYGNDCSMRWIFLLENYQSIKVGESSRGCTDRWHIGDVHRIAPFFFLYF